jgi:hypothetical protein
MHMYDEILEQPSILKECRDFNADALGRIVKSIKKKNPSCVI